MRKQKTLCIGHCRVSNTSFAVFVSYGLLEVGCKMVYFTSIAIAYGTVIPEKLLNPVQTPQCIASGILL